MLAIRTTTGMELLLPSIVRFHEVPAQLAAARPEYAPALSFHQQATAQQALEALRQMDDIGTVYYLFVTDSQERLVGVVTFHQLISASPGARLFEFMDRRTISLTGDASLREQAELMSASGLMALPVVDDNGQLIGAMDASDMIRVMQEESTAELYELAGVDRRENVEQASASATGYRTFWLLSNMVVAFLVAWMMSSFAPLLANFAVLAAFVPMIMMQAAQANRQTLALVVRSLALGTVHRDNLRGVLSRELMSGLVNGVTVGSMAALLCWLWQGQPLLGAVLGMAVLATLVLAALVGVAVPFVCRAINISPTRASGMIASTLTTVGSLAFLLGIGALIW
jgi:magnesium transporter